MVISGVTDTVNTRDRTNNHRVAPFKQALGRRQPHLFNMLINRRVFFDKEITRRHVGLGLVVVVVRHKILNRIFWKKFPHLSIKLRRKRFVGSQNKRRSTQTRDHIGHGEGFTRARHSQ